MAVVKSGLVDFLIRVSEDPELRDAYVQDPAAVAEREGLSTDKRDLVLSGDLDGIRDAAQLEYRGVPVIMKPVTVPKPEPEPPKPKPEPGRPVTVVEPESD